MLTFEINSREAPEGGTQNAFPAISDASGDEKAHTPFLIKKLSGSAFRKKSIPKTPRTASQSGEVVEARRTKRT